MATMPWFRTYSEILDDKKIKRICRLTGLCKATVIGVWICFLALASESEDRGKLLISENIPYDKEDLSNETELNDDDLDRLIQLFIKFDMLAFEGGTYVIKNWDGRQFKSDNSTDRVRKHREMKRDEENNAKRYSNVIDTDTDTELESDTEEESEKNKHMLSQSPHSLALTDENGELAPEEDRIIEIFCDRVGLTGNNRPYENDPSNRKWYADWLREAGEIQKLGISSGEMGEAIAILKASGYSCKHPGAIIETVKNMRKDREAFDRGEKKKLHRYKLEKYTDARGNWNYQPIDWWEEK